MFLVFFKVFDVQGLPGAILARHGLQDDFKNPWNVFHGFQNAFRNLSNGSKGFQDTPKSLQDAPKTPPREVQKSKISLCCSICSLSYAFLGDLRSTWSSKRFQDASKSLQSVPKTVQPASKIRLQEPSVEAEAIYQGWSGGGSAA